LGLSGIHVHPSWMSAVRRVAPPWPPIVGLVHRRYAIFAPLRCCLRAYRRLSTLTAMAMYSSTVSGRSVL
jgi:hypothetical protein